MAFVSFDKLVIGQSYERTFLAELWGYKSHEAISRGSVTPAGTNFIILFITKQKQGWETQYQNYIESNKLFIDGQEKHGSDQRLVDATKSGDEIHLFYRDMHRDPFEYYGKIELFAYTLHTDKPSEFIFSLTLENANDPLDDIDLHEEEYKTLPKTEQINLRKSRIGQGEFRKRVINLWGGCSVTGIQNMGLLKASHSKPWRDCSNSERLDPANGLLLTPNLDHLYDAGLITFNSKGMIVFSSKLSASDIEKLGLNSKMQLREIPKGVHRYLGYHRDIVFQS